MAKKAEDRHNRWRAAVCPPAVERRPVGEPDDDRPVRHPFRNVLQRVLNESRFHRQMTGAREAVGQVPWTVEDMWEACSIHYRSQTLGLAGRNNLWLNEGRKDRSTRQGRGLVTIAVPRGDGTYDRTTRRNLATVASVGPALASTGHWGKGSGVGTDPDTTPTHTPFTHDATVPPP
eukprot:7043055-Pyramimonas_sp.AAC.1